jgi:soluble cytochrome b562
MTDFATLVLAADTRQMTQAERAIDGVTRAGSRAETQTNKTSNAISNMDKMARRAALGAVALAGSIVALTRSSANQIDSLSKQAAQVGILTRNFQAMSLVANEAGVSTETLTSQIAFMQRNLVELGRGTALQTRAFQQLGLTIRDLQGLSPDQQFERIATALAGVQDPAQRTALAMEVFGRSGRAAINMLEGYTDALEDARRFQEGFGLAVSQTSAQAIERANDALGRLMSGFRGVGNVLAVEAAPRVEAFSNRMIELIIQTNAINRSAEILTNTLRVMGVIAATVAASQIPALTIAIIAKTKALIAATTATGLLAGAMGVLRAATIALGGPWAIFAGVLGGAAAAILLFKGNTEATTPILDQAAEAMENIAGILATASDDILPAASRATLNLTNENIKFANSAFKAAEAAVEQAKAFEQIALTDLLTQQAFSPTGRFDQAIANHEAAVRRLTAAQTSLIQKQRELSDAVNAGQLTLSEANAEMAEARRRSLDLTVSIDGLNTSTNAFDVSTGQAIETVNGLNDELQQTPQWVTGVSDAFADLVMRGFKDFASFAQSVVNTFRNMLRDMIAMAARNRIMISLGMGGAAMPGMAAAGVPGIGGQLFSGASSALGLGGAVGGTFSAGMAATMTGGLAGGMGAFTTGIGMMGSASTAMAGLGMAAGAALPVIAAVAAVVSFFGTKTKELDRGLIVTVQNMDTLVQSFRTVERSRFWGLSKRVSTTMEAAADEIANPIIDAVSQMQQGALDAAAALGIGADAFAGFTHEINLSLKGLNEQQAMQKVAEELGKMGDAFAAMVPGIQSLNELLAVAQQRYDLTTRLLQLQGNEEELLRRHREQELNAVHDLNRELLIMIHALEDAVMAAQRAELNAQRSLESARQAVFDAQRGVSEAQQAMANSFAGLRRAVDSEKNRIRDGFNVIIDAIDERLRLANDAARASASIFNALDRALRERRGRHLTDAIFAQRRIAALAFLQSQQGIQITDEQALNDALDVVAEPSAKLFRNFTDYQRDFSKTSILIDGLLSTSGKQLSADEKAVNLLQEERTSAKERFDAEIAKLDEQLATMERQINAMMGVDDSVKTVAEAVKSVESAIGSLSEAVRAQAAAMQAQAQAQAQALAAANQTAAAKAAASAAAAAAANQTSTAGAAARGIEQFATGQTFQGFQVLDVGGAAGLLQAASLTGVNTAGKTGLQISQEIANATGKAIQLDSASRVAQFAAGGVHMGGARIVGERGPELEVTGSSRIFSNSDTMNMLSNAPVVLELRKLKREFEQMRDEQRQLGIQTATNTDRSYRILRSWNVVGLPEERTA